MKIRRKVFGLFAGIMLMISIIALRFGKHFKPRHTETIVELTLETFDDLGKIQTITEMLRENTDSIERIRFLHCLNKLNFFKSSYGSGVEHCYERAMENANKTNSLFSEVLLRVKRSLEEMTDNHYFYQDLYALLQANTVIDFDRAWKKHFKRPSQIDKDYKPLLRTHFNNAIDIKTSLDNSSKLFKQLDSLNRKMQD